METENINDVKQERDLYKQWYNELKGDIALSLEVRETLIRVRREAINNIDAITDDLPDDGFLKRQYEAEIKKNRLDIERCMGDIDTLKFLLEGADKREKGEERF